MEALLGARGITQVCCLGFDSLETIYTAVAAGLACPLLPRVPVGPLARQGRHCMRCPRLRAGPRPCRSGTASKVCPAPIAIFLSCCRQAKVRTGRRDPIRSEAAAAPARSTGQARCFA
ncbi:MAG: hypothetical protein GDA41_06220 [Rhodospirillales bacterium]|nr:hypothetical protein [Rhodospirillales bacterium]